MEDEYFRVQIEDGVARCTMCGPRMNAMGKEMMFPMIEGLESVLDSEEARVIVIRGEGGNFCVGADLTIMGEKMDPSFLQENMSRVNDVLYELHEGPRPVITEVDGWAVGGGFSMAISSDITYATVRAQFYMSFVPIAIIPDLGSSYFLAERVGLARAKELAFTGRIIGAQEALEIGMINKVVSNEEISEEVMKLAGRLARRSPKVLAMTKRNLNKANRSDLRTLLDLEASIQPFFVLAPEHKKAVEKFLAKQKGLS